MVAHREPLQTINSTKKEMTPNALHAHPAPGMNEGERTIDAITIKIVTTTEVAVGERQVVRGGTEGAVTLGIAGSTALGTVTMKEGTGESIGSETTRETVIVDAHRVTIAMTIAIAAIGTTESKTSLKMLIIVIFVLIRPSRTDTTADATIIGETTGTDASTKSVQKTSTPTSKKPRWPTPFQMSTSTETSSTGTASSGSPELSVR